MIDACSDPVPTSGCGGRACSARSSPSSRDSTRPSRRMASCPSAGRLPCAAFPSTTMSTHAKPLWPTAISRSVGSVTIAASARQDFTSASAPMLECSSSTTRPPRRGRQTNPPCVAIGGRRRDHRGDAAFHVLRAAAVQATVPLHRREWIAHPADADRVGVAAEHQRPPWRASLEHTHYVRPAVGDGLDRHLEPAAPHLEQRSARRSRARPARRAPASGSRS